MRLRTKLLLAQAPLALAIVLLGLVASSTTSELAAKTDAVLRDNYRSVLAAQRMKEAIERIDSGAVFLLLGREPEARAQIADNEARFDAELTVEEHNITEAGEVDSAKKLDAAWRTYVGHLHEFIAKPDTGSYFAVLAPGFLAVKDGADEVLAINQDAMVRKSDQAIRSSARARSVIAVVAGLALIAGVVASMVLTTRLLRPLSILGHAVRRIGAGDLVARAQLKGKDEIAQLAQDFNTMAGHLEQYRKSSLGELLVAQSASQAVIDSLPDPVVVVGLRGELLNVNQAAERLVGISVESGRGVSDAEPATREAIERVTKHVLGGNGAYVPRGLDEAFRVPASGGDVQLLPRGAPIYSEEGVIDGTTIVLQDVTRLLRFDELKNNLVATVAHEFRTPLTSLRMAIHMCIEGAVGDLNEKQLDLLYVAREDCERLQTIVDDLLDLSRIQSGRIDISRRRVAPETLVHQAVDAHAAAAKLAGLALRTEVMPGLGEVEADPDRIQLAFDNLINNALRYTKEGEVVVRALPGEGNVRFEVSDTGAGIPLEHQAAIFEKFYRVPGAPKGGAGLGLFIAKEIVEAHGGQIGFSSEPGQGATFWFTIPTS